MGRHELWEVTRAKKVAVERDARVGVARLQTALRRSPRCTVVRCDAANGHGTRIDKARVGRWMRSTAAARVAAGLDVNKVLQVLKRIEGKTDVKDPNAWVCGALRKE